MFLFFLFLVKDLDTEKYVHLVSISLKLIQTVVTLKVYQHSFSCLPAIPCRQPRAGLATGNGEGELR